MASEIEIPKGLIGAVALSFSVTVAEGSMGVCASEAVAPAKANSSEANPVASSLRADFIGPHPSTSPRSHGARVVSVWTEPEMGFEPMTYHLRGGCSTPELLRRVRASLSTGFVAGMQAPRRRFGPAPQAPRGDFLGAQASERP